MRRWTEPELLRALEWLTWPVRLVDEASLKVLKEKVKDRRRELAKVHHPDAGGDPEKMKHINAAVDFFLRLNLIKPEPPKPPPARPRAPVTTVFYTSSGTSSSTDNTDSVRFIGSIFWWKSS